VIHVQGHKVRYSNCSNSAADCPISLRFRTEFDRGKAGLLHMFKVKGHRSKSRGQISRSQRNVTCQQEKRSKTATDRLSDYKLGTGNELKRIGTASSCNAFAVTMFSSCFCITCCFSLRNKQKRFNVSNTKSLSLSQLYLVPLQPISTKFRRRDFTIANAAFH